MLERNKKLEDARKEQEAALIADTNNFTPRINAKSARLDKRKLTGSKQKSARAVTGRESIQTVRASMVPVTPRSGGEENISSEDESMQSGRDRFRDVTDEFVDKTPLKQDRFTELYESAMALAKKK